MDVLGLPPTLEDLTSKKGAVEIHLDRRGFSIAELRSAYYIGNGPIA
jgi:hypothetical protein